MHRMRENNTNHEKHRMFLYKFNIHMIAVPLKSVAVRSISGAWFWPMKSLVFGLHLVNTYFLSFPAP